MRAAKKTPLKSDQKSPALSSKRGGADYSKKAALLEDAITQMNAGKYGRSSAALKELLALDPLNLEARRLFATLHLRLGSLLPARQAFEVLANEALERQDYWLAESLLREYLVAGPRCVPFLEKLGIVYQEKGDDLAAAEEFGKAIDILLEDPDTENSNKPTQLYAKIRELAPASPPAFRLAKFFDAQTGELIAHPAATPAEVSAAQVAPSELVEPVVPEALGVMPWERSGQEDSTASLSGHQSDSTDGPPSLPLSEPVQGQIQAESAPGVDRRTEHSADSHATEAAAVSEPVVSSESTSPVPISDSPAVSIASESVVTDALPSRLEEGPQAFQPDQPMESVPAPMPWDQVQDVTVTIPHTDESSGIETRSASSVATESPFFSLSDAAQSEPQAGSVSAWAAPDTVSSKLDAISPESPLGVSFPSQSVEEPTSTGDAAPIATDSPADATLSSAVEPMATSMTGEPVQELAAGLSDSPQEPVSGEASISWAPPAEAVALPENPPLPEKTETPKNSGFSWESIFSTWKYGPSSSSSKKPVHSAPMDEPHGTGVVQPPTESMAPAPAVHEALAKDPTPVMEIPPEPTASVISEAAQESSIAMPSVDLVEHRPSDSAMDMVASSAGVIAESPQKDALAVDQPEAPALPSPTMADTIEPDSATSPLEIESAEPCGDSLMEMAAESAPVAGPVTDVEPPVEPLPQEVSSSVVASLEPLGQREDSLTLSSGEAAPPVLVEETMLHEATSLTAVDSEPPAEPPVPSGEFRFASFGEPTSLDSAPEAASQEIGSPAMASPEPLGQPAEFRTISANEMPSSAADEEKGERLSPALFGTTPGMEAEPCQIVSAGEPAVVSDEPVPHAADLAELSAVVPASVPAVEEPGATLPELTSVSHQEVWDGTDESIRVVDVQAPSAVLPVEPVSPVASAVDSLFQSSEPVTHSHRSERAPEAKARPQAGATVARFGRGLFSVVGACFSTTQALVMSLVGLVVVVGALAAIAIGAVGVTWVIMEEKPSPAFQSLIVAPQRSPIDSRKNGYGLLLGFDAAAGADPIQAGYERKPGASEEDALSACLGGPDGHSGGGPLNATASVAEDWFRSPNPVAQFKTKADGLNAWMGQAQSSIGRYRQWLKMPFEDGGYGQAVTPPCAAILFAHRLYVAEGFASGQPADSGIHRLQEDMEAWRTALGQAKTLPVKMLAVRAMQDDLAVASGLLVQADFDSKDLPVLATMLRPLDQVESSMRWPMQSELAAASQATDAQLKGNHGEDVPWHIMLAKWLPLPKQRRLNEYAAYYDASSKAAGEGRHSAMPKRAAYIKNPPATVMDYLTNPIENIVGLKPLPSWDQYNGMVIDTDARLRLASVQAWLRRGSQEGDLVTRIAKAGQRFYDPYTGMPMLVNPKRGVIYSVGHDGKDQDADPQQDVVVSVPLSSASSGSAKRL